jgi:hypothetical protein
MTKQTHTVMRWTFALSALGACVGLVAGHFARRLIDTQPDHVVAVTKMVVIPPNSPEIPDSSTLTITPVGITYDGNGGGCFEYTIGAKP